MEKWQVLGFSYWHYSLGKPPKGRCIYFRYYKYKGGEEFSQDRGHKKSKWRENVSDQAANSVK